MIIHQRSKIVYWYVTEQINGHDLAVSLPDIFGSKRTRQQYSDSEAFVKSNVQSEMTMKFSYLISGLIGFLFFSSTVGMFSLPYCLVQWSRHPKQQSFVTVQSLASFNACTVKKHQDMLKKKYQYAVSFVEMLILCQSNEENQLNPCYS